MQVRNVLHAARRKYRTQKGCQKSPSGHHRTNCRPISSQLRHVSTIGKKLVKHCSNMSSKYPDNIVNFGPLTAEIGLGVWGIQLISTVSHLGSVSARQSSCGRQPNFAALNRGRHLCSAGRPARWALAHILVCSALREI